MTCDRCPPIRPGKRTRCPYHGDGFQTGILTIMSKKNFFSRFPFTSNCFGIKIEEDSHPKDSKFVSTDRCCDGINVLISCNLGSKIKLLKLLRHRAAHRELECLDFLRIWLRSNLPTISQRRLHLYLSNSLNVLSNPFRLLSSGISDWCLSHVQAPSELDWSFFRSVGRSPWGSCTSATIDESLPGSNCKRIDL